MIMQILPEIDFQGMEPSPELRARIEKRIERFEKRYGRITACSIVVKGPGGRHQTGGLYELNIHLVLPDGREAVVERTPHLDERFQDFDFALNDAFKRARRGLQDKVRRIEGQVKAHRGQGRSGSSRNWVSEDGYGFLGSPDGRELYFHRNSVADNEFERLELGDCVTFSEEEGERGPQASSVKRTGGRAPS